MMPSTSLGAALGFPNLSCCSSIVSSTHGRMLLRGGGNPTRGIPFSPLPLPLASPSAGGVRQGLHVGPRGAHVRIHVHHTVSAGQKLHASGGDDDAAGTVGPAIIISHVFDLMALTVAPGYLQKAAQATVACFFNGFGPNLYSLSMLHESDKDWQFGPIIQPHFCEHNAIENSLFTTAVTNYNKHRIYSTSTVLLYHWVC